jgi:hypothetical protein
MTSSSSNSTLWNRDDTANNINNNNNNNNNKNKKRMRAAPPPPLETTMPGHNVNGCWTATGSPAAKSSSAPSLFASAFCACPPAGGVSSHATTPVVSNQKRKPIGRMAAQFFLFPSSASSRKKPRTALDISSASAGRRPFDRLQDMLDSLALSTSSSSSSSLSSTSASTTSVTRTFRAASAARRLRSRPTDPPMSHPFACVGGRRRGDGTSVRSNRRLEEARQSDWDLAMTVQPVEEPVDLPPPTTTKIYKVHRHGADGDEQGGEPARRDVLRDNDPNSIAAIHPSTELPDWSAVAEDDSTAWKHRGLGSSSSSSSSSQRRPSSVPRGGERTRRVIDSIIQDVM